MTPPLALYVHLPWCERKCPYCDFNSHEATEVPEAAYVATLLRDLEGELATDASLTRRSVISVFLGGGTPSLFSPDAIARLLSGLRQRVNLIEGAEITMEANPGSTERDRLRGFVQAGVTRFSVGLQSMADDSLQALGRVHNAADAARAVVAARTSGVASFNLDLMHGLPGQSADAGLDDLEQVIAAAPHHISWYQLTIEPNTRFYRYPPALPDEETLGDLEERGIVRLRAAGYHRYEVSAWAQPGGDCRHNLNYWRFGDYLAIGAGAHGKVTGRNGRILRYRKTRRPEDYLRSTGTERRDGKYLASEELPGEFMLGALRLARGFEPELFEGHTGLDFAVLQPALTRLQDEGLLERDSHGVRASSLGWRYLDTLVGRFFDTGAVLARGG